MRKFFFLTCLIISINGFSQETDSVSIKIRTLQDSINATMNRIEQDKWEKQNLEGLNYMMAEQKSRREKEKRNAIIRIAIGVGFLLVLVAGLMRRRKKTVS